jgi:hypothetical protein
MKCPRDISMILFTIIIWNWLDKMVSGLSLSLIRVYLVKFNSELYFYEMD